MSPSTFKTRRTFLELAAATSLTAASAGLGMGGLASGARAAENDVRRPSKSSR